MGDRTDSNSVSDSNSELDLVDNSDFDSGWHPAHAVWIRIPNRSGRWDDIGILNRMRRAAMIQAQFMFRMLLFFGFWIGLGSSDLFSGSH